MPNLAELLGAVRDSADVLGKLRYGVPTSEKERLALSAVLPYAPGANTMDPVEAERFASGFLFQKEHPALAALVQPAVDRVRIGWFGDSPELQSWATAGANAAKARGGSLADLLMGGR